MDTVIAQSKNRGLDVMGVLHSAPRWTNGGRSTKVLPNNPADYASFAGWAAMHYAGQVDTWEVWNEPNGKHGDYASAAEYTTLLCAAYEAIKAANPDATVVSGGLSGLDWEYMRSMYAHGASDCLDVIGVHIYNRGHPPTEKLPVGPRQWLTTMPLLRKTMVDLGAEDTPVWITETGWSTSKGDPDLPPGRYGVTAEEQADYTIQLLRMMQ